MSITYLISNSVFFEPNKFYITFHKKAVRISHKECQVLEALCKQNGTVVSRNYLIDTIWGGNCVADAGLNKVILLLRRKFESNNIPNIIETIPRVGYLLNVSIDILNEQSNDEIVEAETLTQKSERPSLKKINLMTIRRYLFFIITPLATLMLFILFFSFPEPEKALDHRKREDFEATIVYKKNGNLSYSTTKSYQSRLLVKTASLIQMTDGKLSYMALLSPKLFSFILFLDGHAVGQKNFFIKNDLAITSQLSCIDNFISSNISPSRFNESLNKPILSGMRYHTINFYGPCNTTSPAFLAELNSKSTTISENNSSDKMTLINSTLTAPNGAVIFDIERYMHLLGDFWKNDNKNIRLTQKSFHLNALNINLIHQKKEYAMLFSELTKNELNIQKNSVKQGAFIADMFGGYLFYVNRFMEK